MNVTTLDESTRQGAAPRRRRPHCPEDYGRGPWWRLGELFFLGFIFPSPPPLTSWFGDDDEDELER